MRSACRTCPAWRSSRLAEGAQMRALVEVLGRRGHDPEYPDVTPRDAKALREWETMRKAAE